MAMPDLEFNIHRQTEAAKSLLSSLRDQGVEDDAELVADTIEGETSLVEAIEAAMAEIDEEEAHIIGLTAKIEEFSARKDAKKRRVERTRALIEQAMLATDQTSMKLPTATLSLTKRAPGLIIVDESDIPTKYWIEQPAPAPKLDKKALAADLREAKAAIPGATLDNGSFSLTVRRK
ncbi:MULTISPECIES: siphovirus Gp157 family protein [Sinorhizobium]|uniref:siphovirus Gp157 family protein n=1 Tax=Sinorhizobium medicae TaxID=110321 RepID=UPI002AF6BC86|nr:siphovirus Gp157 family protein [Sinorhizobium medicae]WQO85264.1 siphovirus Gp157 family protein [Sinorhizobium medicae]WQP08261.1 siphovirus Gp157 family protein [Sinorhizobium meliloti]WQP21676.1 siphovirus Gp157 family protein [Sinorhizobium meliloti]WQP35092.1 siphovirus Gp157 family protein [Sinorhizobium meliloti]